MPWNVIEINPEGEWYPLKECDTYDEAVKTAMSWQENSENTYLVEEVK